MRVSAPSTADDCIAGLFRPGLLESSPEAANLYSALLAAEETSVLLAFQRNRSTRLLQILLSSPDGLSHAALDAAGTDQATRTVGSMLVEHGLLPLRDNNLARLEGWITSTAAKIPRRRRARRVHPGLRDGATSANFDDVRSRSAPASL